MNTNTVRQYFTGKVSREGYSQGILFFIAIMFFILFRAGSAFGVIYVNVNAQGGNGSSWGTAYKSLEGAINNSDSGQEFWIAKGTYKPSASLLPKEGSLFFGGFAGTEDRRDQRNITVNLTYVDGQNVLKHVFKMERANIRIDGFVIQGGYATGGVDGAGGGIFIYKVPATIVDSTFIGNVAESGGAIYAYEADITVIRCTFEGNRSDIGEKRGGAIWVHKESPVIIDCVFNNNSAGLMGGAIELNNTPGAVITGSVFSDNKVTTSLEGGGGAISLQWDTVSPEPSVIIEDCLFQNNSSGLEGGALYSNRVHVIVSQSTFLDNSAVNGGAVMLDYQLSLPSRVERCRFLNNHAVYGGDTNHYAMGGAICTYVRSIVIKNSIFAYNSSDNNGGALRLHAGHGGDYNPSYSAVVQNATFYDNRAGVVGSHDGWGGAIANTNLPSLDLYNSIFWSNKAVKPFWNEDALVFQESIDVANLSDYTQDRITSLIIRYTNMESLDWEHWSKKNEIKVGSFSLDPLFVDPDGADDVAGTVDDNFQLQATSPCIDRADGDYATKCDMDCYPRIDHSGINNLGTGSPNYADIGALERIENPATSPCSSCSLIPIPPYIPPAPPSGDADIPSIRYLLLRK